MKTRVFVVVAAIMLFAGTAQAGRYDWDDGDRPMSAREYENIAAHERRMQATQDWEARANAETDRYFAERRRETNREREREEDREERRRERMLDEE